MIDRRMYLLGGLGLVGLAASEALRPRERLVLLRKGTIDEAMPRALPGWSSEVASGLVSPEQAGRLARTLYSEMVSRVYYEEATGAGAMVMIAYGDTQSDLLQLHRPESCYPAVGFALQMTRPLNLPIGGGATLPCRQVVATTEDRTENIVYWTRLGERLPQSGGEQRTARLRNAMDGYVADGILVRCAVLGDSEPAFATLRRFVPTLLSAIQADQRGAFIGSQLTRQMVA